MLRKLFLIGGGMTLVSLFFLGRDCASYVGTCAGRVRDSVRGSVPVEFEIQRARTMIKDLAPEIRRNMHVIAREEVEVERLDGEIKSSEGRLGKEKEDIVRLKGDLTSRRDRYEYAGHRYTVQQVKLDLANRFERFKTADATLSSLREMQQARTRGLEAARQKLEGMLAAKRQLEVDVENLEARRKMVEVAETTSLLNVDDSQLARARDLVGQLRTRLQVAERLLSSEGRFRGEIPLDDKQAADVVEQVTQYFQTAAPDAPAAVADAEH